MDVPAPGPGAPQKLDVHLEGLAAYQAGATQLKAGEPLAVRADGGRLECVTQAGVPVGLVPADKVGVLSRGPWAGTVRSVKRRPGAAAPAAVAPSDGSEAAPAAEPAACQEAAADGPTEPQQGAAGGAQLAVARPQTADAAAEPADGRQQPAPAGAAQQVCGAQASAAVAAAPVVQLLVRFVPEEQRWERRGEGSGAGGAEEDWDTARLSREQFEALAGSEELRWLLRDERLQKVIAEVDAAPDRERALARALQAPNFKEFADKVLNVVAPAEPP